LLAVESDEMQIISAAETSARQNTSTDSTGNEPFSVDDDVVEEIRSVQEGKT
jgi:hypothetical protein